MSEESLRELISCEAAECELAHQASNTTEKNFHFALAAQYASLIIVLRQVNLNKCTHICSMTLS
jgi:hypothetical protein